MVCTFVSQFLDIEDSDFDAPLREEVDDYLADAVASSCYNYNLLTPGVSVVTPVIRHGIVKPRRHARKHAQRKQCLEVLERGAMLPCPRATLLGVFCSEEERERDCWVERRELEESPNCVAGHAWWTVLAMTSIAWCAVSVVYRFGFRELVAYIPSRARLHSLRIGMSGSLSLSLSISSPQKDWVTVCISTSSTYSAPGNS